MKFWVFILSAIVSLPRHFATVYIGVALEDETSGQLRFRMSALHSAYSHKNNNRGLELSEGENHRLGCVRRDGP